MSRKLGTCSSCRQPIYSEDGPRDACACDDGVLTTLDLREGTPVAPVRANRNGDVLPELDLTLFMSPQARSELAAALEQSRFRPSISMGATVASAEIELTEDGGFYDETPLEGSANPFDISFDTGEEWASDLPRPVQGARQGSFRVDRPVEHRPFSGRVASGPSDGVVVGRVGQPARPQMRQIERIFEVGREGSVEMLPRSAPVEQVSRALPAPRPVARVEKPSGPVTPALQRLGSVKIGGDPFQ